MISLQDILTQTNYLAYAYSYPHKTAYRALSPRAHLSDVWAKERRDRLFLYLHVPFCEMRCGFCNLFTTANPKADFQSEYMKALHRQAERVHETIGEVSFSRLAIGGGTPTYLSCRELDDLLDIAEKIFSLQIAAIPTSVETSPLTAEPEKLRLLHQRGVDRISIGVQSFNENEVAAIGRSQNNTIVETALSRIKEIGFPTLNIDLIYGLPGQSVASWLETLQRALSFQPEEIYIYPLYIRPLTGLHNRRQPGDDLRLACYRAARMLLIDCGYDQISMRMFEKGKIAQASAPVYCCQDDGMIGLGCGARSYTSGLHYASEYAVGGNGIRDILADYISKPGETYQFADYGFALNIDEQRRRYVIQSLLQAKGLNLDSYRARFGGGLLDDLPQLTELVELDLAINVDDIFQLSASGLESSDAIGFWCYSDAVRALMESYQLR